MCNRQREVKPEIERGLEHFSRLFSEKWDVLIDLPILQMTEQNLLKNKGPYPEFLAPLNQKLIPLLREISSTEAILGRLAQGAQKHLERVVEKEDLFFFDDLLKQMQQNVHRPEFSQIIREQYAAVLIDEFQDTDPMQWDIFSTLFLGHKPLYLVGDPKQSIYRFRGADLYTYMEAQKAMGEEAKASLIRNYRSAPQLVEALNLLFSRTPDLITLPKLGTTLSLPPVEAALTEGQGGEICFCRAEDEATLFSFIHQQIEQLHQEKQIPYSECAVLVKDHAQAKRFLESCPLPVTPKKSASLAETQALAILEELLHAIYNPRERTLIAKALGGPFFNLSLEQLSEGFESYIPRFYTYHHLLETKGILVLFQAILKQEHFPGEALYIEILQLVELLAEYSPHSEEYLPFLQKLKEENPDSDKFKARAKSEEDAIQLMTIHMSKGLEFEVVFPVGLILTADMKEEQERSEKMRQLYVALTRAKQKLYLPLLNREKTPLHQFITQVLRGESVEQFVANHSYFTLKTCAEMPLNVVRTPKKLLIQDPSPLNFIPYAIHSYSSLAPKQAHTPLTIPATQLPAGPQTGTVLHALFEEIPFKNCKTDLRPFISNFLKGSHLESWETEVHTLIKHAFETPLQGFCLQDVAPQKLIKEMEFLYPSKSPCGYLKGFIDLFFEHQNSYYIIDWKSNYLEDYSPDALQKACQEHSYALQASVYRQAAVRYLKLFGRENHFGGCFYLFLRGLDPKTGGGVVYYGN
ncbi:MAG: RecBCD enzyme subunit RecB [Chlamydiales bacterium]|nr:RecBCD enzyme subunit RecB [Chlamydiales bacterium]